ncbi:MAG TPA: SLC13 family permease, partial [Myxococcales bacterium]|nr:SLC13 family permease [Myxococcales bacterium]
MTQQPAALNMPPRPEEAVRHQSLRWIGAGLCTAFAIYIAFLRPPEGLNRAALGASAVLIWAVSFWILDVMPEYIVGMLMCTFWSVFKIVPFDKAFANFSSSNWWIMVGAFGLGAAATKSGLLRRIALRILKACPPTFMGQSLGLLGAGTVLSPLVPSASARSALASPIALAISDSLGYRRKTSAASGLFGAMYLGFCVVGSPLFLTGTFINYATMAQFPKAYQGVSWLSWLLYGLPWGILTFVGCAVALYLLYRPSGPIASPATTASDELARLGPMTREEKATALVLVLTLAMWMTEGVHKISAGEVAVVSLCVLLALDVLTRDDFRKRIDWSSIIYIGALLNLGTVFQTLKIDLWLGHALQSTIASFVSNPYIFVVAFAIVVLLARFVIVSITSAAVIFTIVFSPLVPAYGMHPWMIAFIALAASNV